MPVRSYITDPLTSFEAEVTDRHELVVTAKRPQPVVFGGTGGVGPDSLTLPFMINLVYLASDGAIVANSYKRVLSYTIPDGYAAYLIKYTSFQDEAAISRVVAQIQMATLSIVTNAYDANQEYEAPQFSSLCQAEVTQALSSGSGNVVVTVTYTNHAGVAGRTGTITIPKGSAVGSRWSLVLQAGDIGIRSVEAASVSPTLAAGAVKFLGLIQLAPHQDLSATVDRETSFGPGVVSIPAGTVIGVEYAGGTVSKTRNFDVLLQLVEVVT